VSYTFRVIFEGVLAYVPDKPFFVECREKYPSGEWSSRRGGRCYIHNCNDGKCCTRHEDDAQCLAVCYPPCCKRRDDADRERSESGDCRGRDKDEHGERLEHQGHGHSPEVSWVTNDAVRSLTVLMPDLRRPGTPSVPGGYCPPCPLCQSQAQKKDHQLNYPRFREPHFPLLSFRLSDLRERTTRRVDLVTRDISEKEELGLLFLRREQIRFAMEAENSRNFSFAGWAPCPPPPAAQLPDCCKELRRLPKWWGRAPDLGDREQLESLWWLPDLRRIVDPSCQSYRKATRVRHDFLPSYRGPFPEGLIARVECKGGRLRTFDFNRGVDGRPFSWRFAPLEDAKNYGSWNRALANSVALEFFDVRGEVSIELKRLANEVSVENLVLAPAPGASRPVLEIVISNREPDLLFQEDSFNKAMLPDVDFQPFYEQVSELYDQNEGVWSQLPVPHLARSAFFGPVEKPCAGTSMLGEGGE
jgi:hypothetical protein